MYTSTLKLAVLTVSVLVAASISTTAQTFLNGDFEANTSSSCAWNLPNTTFNGLMTNITAYGSADEVDIQEAQCGYATPKSGNYFISLHRQFNGSSDEVALELSAPLVAGNAYTIKFYDQANTIWDGIDSLQVGLSTTANDFGSRIYSTLPVKGVWTERVFSFIAPLSGSFVTVKVGSVSQGINPTGWNFVDNFSITCTPAKLGENFMICRGQSMQLDPGIPNASYMWQDGSTQQTYTASQPGTYWVEVSMNNCYTSDTIVIVENPVYQLDLGNDTSICKGQEVQLNTRVPQASCVWQDNYTGHEYTAQQPGTYWVTLSYGNCSTTDSITINDLNCDIEFIMPNVFTPNGDGVNEDFRPLVTKGIIEGKFVVCNRWGQHIYMADDLSVGWDGRNNGSECPAGTYFWIAEYTDVNGELKKVTGALTLLR